MIAAAVDDAVDAGVTTMYEEGIETLMVVAAAAEEAVALGCGCCCS